MLFGCHGNSPVRGPPDPTLKQGSGHPQDSEEGKNDHVTGCREVCILLRIHGLLTSPLGTEAANQQIPNSLASKNIPAGERLERTLNLLERIWHVNPLGTRRILWVMVEGMPPPARRKVDQSGCPSILGR